MMKDSGHRIRVPRNLRDKFYDVCKAQDRPAAQVIRDFMRDYVCRHEAAQGDPAADPQLRIAGEVDESRSVAMDHGDADAVRTT